MKILSGVSTGSVRSPNRLEVVGAAALVAGRHILGRLTGRDGVALSREALDEGILKLAEDAYKEIVELGGDPVNDNTTLTSDYIISYVTNLQKGLSNIQLAYFSEPPESVVRAFEITKQQWNILNLQYRKELESISNF